MNSGAGFFSEMQNKQTMEPLYDYNVCDTVERSGNGEIYHICLTEAEVMIYYIKRFTILPSIDIFQRPLMI